MAIVQAFTYLGQLVVCATRPVQPCGEVFHIEDDRLADGLRDLMSGFDSSGELRSKAGSRLAVQLPKS